MSRIASADHRSWSYASQPAKRIDHADPAWTNLAPLPANPNCAKVSLRERVARCERERATSRVRGHGAQHKLLPLTRSLPRTKSGVGTALSHNTGTGDEHERPLLR